MLNEQEQFVWDIIDEDGGFDLIEESVELLKDYMSRDYYASKDSRLDNITRHITETDLYDWVIAVWTTISVNEYNTYQSVCGKLNGRIPLEDTMDRVKTIAEIIAVIAKTGLIDVNRNGAGFDITLTTDYELGVPIPNLNKHSVCMHRPQPVEGNWDPEAKSMLLGNPMNHHNDEICLDHLNYMNSIPLTLNKRFLDEYRETTDTEWDTPDQRDNWNAFVEQSLEKYVQVIGDGNKFFMRHKYDTRGRTYCCGYHINYQGASYKKAPVELWEKEVVNG